jgi:tRNA (cmo5U34)-methyltransferase
VNQKRFANELGEEYDLFQKVVPHHDSFQAAIAEAIKVFALVCDGSVRVVEVGVGTGITTKLILDVDTRIYVTGIDNEPRTLHIAREALTHDAQRVNLIEQDMLNALRTMPNVSADIFASAYTLHNVAPEYRAALLQEVARILRPGGLFVNGDKYALDDAVAHDQSLKQQLKDFEKFTELGRPDLRDSWTKHYLEDDRIRMIESESKNQLAELGFGKIETVFRLGMEAVITAYKVTAI